MRAGLSTVKINFHILATVLTFLVLKVTNKKLIEIKLDRVQICTHNTDHVYSTWWFADLSLFIS